MLLSSSITRLIVAAIEGRKREERKREERKERKGKERIGKERKGKERKGKERGKEEEHLRKYTNVVTIQHTHAQILYSKKDVAVGTPWLVDHIVFVLGHSSVLSLHHDFVLFILWIFNNFTVPTFFFLITNGTHTTKN